MSSNHPHAVPNLISEHGVIGDMNTLALVAQNGSIDFLCHPNIDSPSLFCGLLDPQRGGEFRLWVDKDGLKFRQIYLPDTNILITRFLGDSGIGEVSDFMPVDGSGRIVRRAKAVLGDMRFSLLISPRPEYGGTVPELRPIQGGCAVSWRREADGVRDEVHFLTSFEFEIQGTDVIGHRDLRQGETAYVVMCPNREGVAPLSRDYVASAFTQTRDFWHHWVARGSYPVYWRELVVRSALTLKLLTSARNGSIAAAGTFGLPEVIGGERNWDYRFCWVRDSAFTLYALSRLNYFDEAEAFIHFLMERVTETGTGEDSGLHIMYAMDGAERLPEVTLDSLSGYDGSQPVRIGNAAYQQRQMDIFGEFMDAVYISTRARGKPTYAVWFKLSRLMDWLCANWHLPDKGIWESRGPDREYLSSRLMCWVALDRGLRIAHNESLPADVERWRTERDKIQRTIVEEFWNKDLGAFTQYKGGKTLDAVVLLMPLVKFINPRDPMWTSTLDAVRRNLVHDCLVKRYLNTEEADGLQGEEGAFTICSFWYVEALARTGYVAEARLLFEKLHAYANHLGLYSEELSSSGDHLGNFPQGLTHLSLISAAIWLDRALNSASDDPANFHHQMIEDPDGVY
ncbi:glycoside hydrolase family 15 protein [Aureimonas jatrophae]|uniref:Glucoamylase (Glucan-1,4-alpha-glucosidase), GH15 family n=1 Tax=Aureimonas jatrophae TaxID=1166073 RepID=A0A1H0IFE5_9HYPH|nr:glycoside hydrolase family 15 protein [Aureimonas jatrophae]MBB3952139.1 GH15 family glucan-1,4-alpha-glucosidase [Aureimonas jatrophae]SDO30112.1 Glucoamylase (glucan-1,4-alpha-glucosidase), GH15 family [Aureimonas jatrophae]